MAPAQPVPGHARARARGASREAPFRQSPRERYRAMRASTRDDFRELHPRLGIIRRASPEGSRSPGRPPPRKQTGAGEAAATFGCKD
jgi:hypothetical protein